MNEQLTTAERRKERIDRGIKVRTEGIYAVSSWQEVTYLVLPRLILIVGLLLLPLPDSVPLLEKSCIHCRRYMPCSLSGLIS